MCSYSCALIKELSLITPLLNSIICFSLWQRMLLGIIVSSLEEHSQLSALLGYKKSVETEDSSEHDLGMTETLMNTLLDNLHQSVVRENSLLSLLFEQLTRFMKILHKKYPKMLFHITSR